jgi:hypothetical protein
LRQRAPRLALIIATVAGAAAAITAVVTTGTSATTTAKSVAAVSSSSATTDVRHGTQSDDAIRAYWTPARLRAAKPAPAPATPSATALAGARAIPDNGATVTVEPTGGTGVTLDGQAERKSAPIVYSRIWTDHTKAPALTTGKLYFTNQLDGLDYRCSASVVTSKGKDLVWTAGHCLFEGGSNKRAGWHVNVFFRPDLVGTEPYSWQSRGTFVLGSRQWEIVPPRWITNGDPAYDMAAFTVAPYKGHKLQDYVGSQGIKFKAGHALSIKDFGYPETLQPFTTAHPQGTRVDGYKLRYSTGMTWSAYGGAFLEFKTNLGLGASGGPWLTGINSAGHGYIVGINTLGGRIRMFTPYLGSQALAMYNAINGK